MNLPHTRLVPVALVVTHLLPSAAIESGQRLSNEHNPHFPIADQTDVEGLDTPQLAERCQQETARSRQKLPHDPRYCLELVRRAILAGDQTAWKAVNAQYQDLIRHWAGNPADAEDLVQETLARFSASITRERLADFPTLGSLLEYLKVIAKNLVIDHQRRAEREKRGLVEWLAELECQSPPDVDTHLDREALMTCMRSRLRDPDEELVFTEVFELGLSPKEVAARHPERFSTAKEVHRIKERFLQRLRRDPHLRRLAGIE